jgi:hypothetical protein
MGEIIKECEKILKCNKQQLRDFLLHPLKRERVLKELVGRKVTTTYEARNGSKKTFYIGGITREGANTLKAYGDLSRTYNISVAAHFYARHRIRIDSPYLPCIIEKYSGKGKDRYITIKELGNYLIFKLLPHGNAGIRERAGRG